MRYLAILLFVGVLLAAKAEAERYALYNYCHSGKTPGVRLQYDTYLPEMRGMENWVEVKNGEVWLRAPDADSPEMWQWAWDVVQSNNPANSKEEN